MEQMETAQRLAGCSFAVNGVPFWGKLKARMEQILSSQMESAFRLPNRGREPKVRYALGPGVARWPGRNAVIERGSPERGHPALDLKQGTPTEGRMPSLQEGTPAEMRLFPARRRSSTAGLGTRMEQMETAQRLAGCSFSVGGVPFWGELKAH